MELVLIRLVAMGSKGMFSDPHYSTQGLQVELVLIRLVAMSSKGMFSDPHSRYTGGAGFNHWWT